ncbi:MAG TPA: Ig-like domain-containing protein, partial [Gemmatimonadales bacterium]|nr:Ig-like domain-containing protein [Gemmatimonadales bacterium]
MTLRHRRVRLRRLVVLVALVVACSTDATGPASVASVQVNPASAQAQVGSTVQLSAMPRDANGGDLPGRPVTWSSGNTAVATVNGNGVVTGASLGTAQITATSEGRSGQATVTVVPGSATQLVFTTPPGTVTAGAAFAPAVQVAARDALGNTATGFTGPVTLAFAANPGGATLGGTTTVAAAAGVATFTGVSLDKSGVGYTLQASAGGVPAVTSPSFSVTPATATHLVFSVQPGTTVAGATIAPALQVTARDAFGNTATGFTAAVTIAIGTNPSGGTLSGTATVDAVSGVAIFGALSIDASGTGYTLTAAATGLGGATSAPFSITAASVSASLSTVVATPPTITASNGSSASTVTVTARDPFGNPVGGVTVVLAASGSGNTVTQPGPTNASGVATGTVSSTVVGVKTISATVGGVAVSQTASVTVDPGIAAQLAFTVQPSTTPAGYPITPAVQVSARDAFGNATPEFSGTVTVAIGTNPG